MSFETPWLVTIHLRPKSFAVLRYLAEHPGRLLTKEELLEAVWPGVVVSESVISVCLSELRKALGDRAQSPRYIETAPRRGYRFVGGVTGSGRAPGGSAAPPARPIVGRRTELAWLRGCWETALRGKRQLVFVTGEPGIGKSTVVDAFLAEVAGEHETWSARGQCIEHYGGGEPYLSVLDALARLCRGPEGERVTAVLRLIAPTWLAQMPWLLDAAAQAALERRALTSTRDRMLRELAEAVEALSRERPLLLLLEDLHWSDGATVDLLAWLARRREPARLLLIGSYRSLDAIGGGPPLRAVTQELARHRSCAELAVEPLTAADVAEYLSARLPPEVTGSTSLEALAAVIHQRTDGHPLFMVTLVDHLLSGEGRVIEDAQRWIETAIAEVERELPDSLRQMIEQQLRALEDEERRVLDAASVAGIEFSAAAVAAGLGTDVTMAEERCASLERQQRFLLRSGVETSADGTVAQRYRFRHGLYRHVVYQEVPEGTRVQLHRRVARQLEESYGAAAGDRAAELAGHFERGLDPARAVRYRRLAADNAIQRCAYREAVEHLTTARALLPSLADGPERIQSELAVLTTLGPALIATRGHAAPEVEATYVRARELCLALGESPLLFRVLRGLSMLYLNRSELRRVRELAEERLHLARQHGDVVALLGAHDAVGAILYHLGEFPLARHHLEEGLALSRTERRSAQAIRDGATDSGVACLGHLAWTLWLLGFPTQALERSEEAIAVARELSHPFSLVQALYWSAQLHQFCLDAEGTRERAHAALGLATAHGFTQQRAQALLLHGWALTRQGREREGVDDMRHGLEGWEKTGAKLLRPYYLALLAETSGRAGQAKAGLRLVSEALSTAHVTGERSHQAELLRLQGTLRLAADPGQDAAAEASFQQALAVSRRQQARSIELRAAMSLARVWHRRGRHADARRLLAEVYGHFAEPAETMDLREASALLAELSSPSAARAADR